MCQLFTILTFTIMVLVDFQSIRKHVSVVMAMLKKLMCQYNRWQLEYNVPY